MQTSGDLTLASLLSAIIAMLGGSFALFRYVQSEIRRVLDHTDSEVAILETNQSKIRHEKMNELQAQISRLDLTLEQLRMVSVRREEMLQMESRFVTRIDRLESKVDQVTVTLPMIVERLDALKNMQQRTIDRNAKIDQGRNSSD